MKKVFILFAVICFSAALKAQNVQMHYDFGKDRKYVTTTVEMFRPDNYGSTFFFIDMDYNDKNGVSAAYWEIARELKFWEAPVSLHVEYNGGVTRFDDKGAITGQSSATINDAYLLGASYFVGNAKMGFTATASYKYIKGLDETPGLKDASNSNFQLTGVWYMNFLDNKVSFTGFMDLWKEKNLHGDYIFITEPQIWYNATKNLSVGSEVEISNNFATHDGWMVNPTLAAKWTF